MFWNKSNKKKIVIELDKDYYPAGILLFDKNQLNSIFSAFIEKQAQNTGKSYEDKKDKFVEYLTEIAIKSNKEHYSINTANSYKSAINTIGEDFLNINLWAVNNLNEIKEIIEKLSTNSAYLARNEETNATLSNGLARYKEFIEHQSLNKNK